MPSTRVVSSGGWSLGALFVGVLCLLVVASGDAQAQRGSAELRETIDPSCDAELCADEAAIVVATHTILQSDRRCQRQGTTVLRELFLQPMLVDPYRKSGSPRIAPIGRLEGYGLLSYRRHGLPIALDSLEGVSQRASDDRGCVLIFGPVQWIESGMARVELVKLGPESGAFSQHFLFIRRAGGLWRVERSEVGMRS